MSLPSISISESYESSGRYNRGEGPVLMFHHLPCPGQNRGKYIYRYRQLLRKQLVFLCGITASAPSHPMPISLPPRTGETDPATQPLGRKGLGRVWPPQGKCVGPEVGLGESSSEGSHPHWLSAGEEGILGGFCNPTRSPLPEALFSQAPSPRSPAWASLSLPVSEQPRSPLPPAPKWGSWFFMSLPLHKQITTVHSPEPLETAGRSSAGPARPLAAPPPPTLGSLSRGALLVLALVSQLALVWL